MTTGILKVKHGLGKQREKMLDGLAKLLKVGRVTQALEAMREGHDRLR